MWHHTHMTKMKLNQQRWTMKDILNFGRWKWSNNHIITALKCQLRGPKLLKLTSLTPDSSQASTVPLSPDFPQLSPTPARYMLCSRSPHHWSWKWWETDKGASPFLRFLAPTLVVILPPLSYSFPSSFSKIKHKDQLVSNQNCTESNPFKNLIYLPFLAQDDTVLNGINSSHSSNTWESSLPLQFL